jgi:hypothetical protein
MLNLFGKLKVKKNNEQENEARCHCGEIADRIPGEKKEIYFCQKCNKLLYYVDPAPSLTNVIPLNLGLFKRRK